MRYRHNAQVNLFFWNALEPLVGYSRAVRLGNLVFVSGTTATDERGELVGAGDAYAQTIQILKNIEKGLQGVAAKLEDVVRTRIFVTNIDLWQEVGRAHGEVFKHIRPATTMVQVQRLISPHMLVEIETDAVVVDGESKADSPLHLLKRK